MFRGVGAILRLETLTLAALDQPDRKEMHYPERRLAKAASGVEVSAV